MDVACWSRAASTQPTSQSRMKAMRTTSLAILSALSLLFTGSASAQSRLTFDAQEEPATGGARARLVSATDAAGPILRMPTESAPRPRRNGLPALRRKPRTAPAVRQSVRMSQVPTNSLPGEASRGTATQRSFPRPPVLQRSRDRNLDRLDPPQPPPELNSNSQLPDFMLPETVPTVRSAPAELQDADDAGPADAGSSPDAPPMDGMPVINNPYQGATIDFFLPPRPCYIRNYWDDYCNGGHGHSWLGSLGWGCKKFGCRNKGRCRGGHCHGGCEGGCSESHVPIPAADADPSDSEDVLLPPGPLPPRNELPQVRALDEPSPRR